MSANVSFHGSVCNSVSCVAISRFDGCSVVLCWMCLVARHGCIVSYRVPIHPSLFSAHFLGAILRVCPSAKYRYCGVGVRDEFP